MENRKKDHIEMAFDSRLGRDQVDNRFYYEPVLKPHPEGLPFSLDLGGSSMKAPVWVSSMTGGTEKAGKINRNLASVCREFGLGMGLGSCRIILEDDKYFEDFNMRPLIGEQPLYANLGIAQVESLLDTNRLSLINRLIDRLKADGLIIHVNPLQEWFQPEGDRLMAAPIDIIKELIDQVSFPLIVKEVGQGMGKESLRALLQLPLQAIEFAAFGGTNFARLELMRSDKTSQDLFEPLSHVGHDAYHMLEMVNELAENETIQTKNLIISGGIRNFLDGYYLIGKSKLPAVYGMASGFLKYAQGDYSDLKIFTENQIKGLELAYNYLTIRE